MSLASAKTRFSALVSALVEEAVTTHEQIVVTRNGEQARREADDGDVIGEEEMAALLEERLGRGVAE